MWELMPFKNMSGWLAPMDALSINSPTQPCPVSPSAQLREIQPVCDLPSVPGLTLDPTQRPFLGKMWHRKCPSIRKSSPPTAVSLGLQGRSTKCLSAHEGVSTSLSCFPSSKVACAQHKLVGLLLLSLRVRIHSSIHLEDTEHGLHIGELQHRTHFPLTQQISPSSHPGVRIMPPMAAKIAVISWSKRSQPCPTEVPGESQEKQVLTLNTLGSERK